MDDPSQPDALDVETIRAGLRGPARDWRLEAVAMVDSTNARVIERTVGGEPPGLVLFAEEQTAGRGRRGNMWLAPPRQCLLFSLLLRPPVEVAGWSRYALAAAVAVARAVEACYGLSPQVKWPNDVLLDRRKVAGILIESLLGSGNGQPGAMVIGVGLNVHVRYFPPEVAGLATSLTLAGGRPESRNPLAAELLNQLAESCELAATNSGFARLCAAFEHRDALCGQMIVATLGNGETVRGRAAGISADGALRVVCGDGNCRLLHDAHRIRPVEESEDIG